ncbi:endoplasmic reticulum protein [Naematelia encephala]|uniref:Endoplasmic reticulum protein n=1 Tax=Naematelia encephala TaxID=71784 RepID=A0A1Y2AM64_9TREE|nr:endoplasmic reticulum protein [Naematelia encephala]
MSELLQTTLSATGAAVSVILVLAYGYLARRYNFLSQEGENNMSSLSVTIFLPCLLFSEIGPLASWSNLREYWIILVYAVLFQLISWIFGVIGTRLLRCPQWLVPCLIFNNATSLPLLLLKALGANGTLDSLSDGDLDKVLSRGRVYLLINTLVCNLARFSFGPYLMKGEEQTANLHYTLAHSESPYVPTKVAEAVQDATRLPAQELPTSYPNIDLYPAEAESAPLLHKAKVEGWRSWLVIKFIKSSVRGFLNPPTVGGLLAIIAGLIPFVRHTLFSKSSALGPLSQSLSNLGDLYTVLQMFVLGAHLQSKRGSRPPFWPLFYLFTFRFAIMPIISTSVIYGVRKAAGNHILRDPILDFTMAIAPVGPPALTLAAIAEMSHADDETNAAIAQTIVLSYVFTPLISFSVAGALKAVNSLYE